MKAVILNGSRTGENGLKIISKVVSAELDTRGWTVEEIELQKLNITPCTGCFNCWIKTPGVCIYKDDALEVTKKIIQSDLVVLLTPVTFGGYSSELKKALDRSLGIMLPYFTKIQGKTHHKKRYKTYPRMVAIGTLPKSDAGTERIFKELVSRNSINAHAPAFSAAVISAETNEKDIRRELTTILKTAGVRK
jgi:multimeric flavodoxin WrbA